MSEPLLQVKDLTARVEETELLHGVSLDIGAGETHVLMGPNGAGKSTLGYTLMGSPAYKVTGGSIRFDGEAITELSSGAPSARRRESRSRFSSSRRSWRRR